MSCPATLGSWPFFEFLKCDPPALRIASLKQADYFFPNLLNVKNFSCTPPFVWFGWVCMSLLQVNLSEFICAAPLLCLENITSWQFSVTFVSPSLYVPPFRRFYCQNRYTQSNRSLTNWGDGYLEAETMLTSFDSSFIYSHYNIMVSAGQVISPLCKKKNEKTIQSPSSHNQ